MPILGTTIISGICVWVCMCVSLWFRTLIQVLIAAEWFDIEFQFSKRRGQKQNTRNIQRIIVVSLPSFRNNLFVFKLYKTRSLFISKEIKQRCNAK